MIKVEGKRKVVLFATDYSFLVPTLFAASQVASQIDSRKGCDLKIISTKLPVESREIFVDIAKKLGGEIIDISFDEQEFLDGRFNKTHIPVATMMRLFTPDFLGSDYDQVLYLDGDIEIVGKLDELLEGNVPPGKIVAGPDRFVLGGISFGWQERNWKEDIRYINSLGIEQPSTYFNAGVLGASLGTWSVICKEALEFFRKKSEICRFFDQSALNAVCKGNVVSLSPAYNFHTSFQEIRGEDFIRPRIVHFTGPHKPWLIGGEVTDNGSRYCAEFRSFLGRFPDVSGVLLPKVEGRLSIDPPPSEGLKSVVYNRYVRWARRRAFRRYVDQHCSEIK